MEFDLPKTALAYLVVFAVIGGGTFMSPMSSETVMMVLGGLFVFGILSLALGVKHGEYRATR